MPVDGESVCFEFVCFTCMSKLDITVENEERILRFTCVNCGQLYGEDEIITFEENHNTNSNEELTERFAKLQITFNYTWNPISKKYEYGA